MFGPTAKYRNLGRDPIDDTPMSWHSHPDGYPVRAGDAPNLIDKARLAHAGTNLFARSGVFKIPDELEKFTKVFDWIANSGSVLYFEKYKETADGWVAWLAWFDVRGYIPDNAQMAATHR